MEILLGLVVVVIGASSLYVALTFNARTQRSAAPLIEHAISELSQRIEAANGATKSQLQDVKKELSRVRELAPADSGKIETLTAQAGRHVSQMGQLRAQLGTFDRLAEQLEARHQQLADELVQVASDLKLLSQTLAVQDENIATLADKLGNAEAQAAARIGALRNSLKSIEMQLSDDRAGLALIGKTLAQHTSMLGRRESGDRFTRDQLLGLIAQSEAILQTQGEFQDYLFSRLDYETGVPTAGDVGQIVAAGLHLGGPGADILWPLFRSFAAQLPLELLFARSWHGTGRRAYLRWASPGGQQLSEILSSHLLACASTGKITPTPGGLPDLLLALHVSGPGTIQLGPMIINRTGEALRGYVMTAAETPRGNPFAWLSSEQCEAVLEQAGQDRITALTSWAAQSGG